MANGNSTQCNKIIILLIIVILMYLILCKNGFNMVSRMTGGNSVMKVTNDNKKELSNEVVFLKIYTDWCGYCKKLKPAWDELGKEGVDGVTIAELDADAEPALAKEYGARGYPTILLMKKGEESVKYDGARDVESMKNYLENNK